MEIVTTRLKMRSIEDEDYSLYAELAKEHKLFRRFYGNSPEETKQSYWKMVREGGAEYFSLFLRDNGDFIGSIHIIEKEELYFHIDILNRFQKFGYSTEAIKAFMDYLSIERQISRVLLEISSDNAQAERVFKHLGAYEQPLPLDDSNALRQIIDAAGSGSAARNVKKYILDWNPAVTKEVETKAKINGISTSGIQNQQNPL